MHIINIHEAKTQFSKLIEEVMNGETITIARAGKPVAILGPLPKKNKIKLGVLKGKIKISKDFDTSLPDDILNDFEG